MKDKSIDNYMYISLLIISILILICTLIYLNFFRNLNIFSCAIYDNFGIYCPGCGCTRAFNELIHFNILKSIYYNPTVFYSISFTIIYLFTQTFERILKKEKHLIIYSNIYLYIGIVIFVLNCIVRNILLLGFSIKV